jgi:acetylornithine transaminase
MFDVYDLMNIEPVRAEGMYFWDREGNRYLDLYGGHAVISIGHTHPRYVEDISAQLKKIGFYSNSVQNPLQEELEEKLKNLSGCADYNLFLCNSGAEANENALKLASFVTGRSKVLTMRRSFHGRTSGAVAVTDNLAIQAPWNTGHPVTFIPLNDVEALGRELSGGEYAAVIVEGIQGVGGIRVAEPGFLQAAREYCDRHGTLLILDEIQSGYGRSGRFFAHQYAGIKPDMITMAKGMGNGFPVAGVLIRETIEAKKGMLGTTFGGNHLACAAAIAVLDVLKEEKLVENAAVVGEYLMDKIKGLPGVIEVRGKGLMIGVDMDIPHAIFRRRLLANHRIVTGYSGKNTLRLLPPLCMGKEEADYFVERLTYN